MEKSASTYCFVEDWSRILGIYSAGVKKKDVCLVEEIELYLVKQIRNVLLCAADGIFLIPRKKKYNIL